MKRVLLLLSIVLLSPLPAASVFAQTPTCNKLAGSQKKLAKALLDSEHPYDCCDRTIAKCLKQKPVCALAYRLAENICRRVAKGEDEKQIKRALSRRARTAMQSKKAAAIELDGVPVIGEADAPITLVEYACARCPFCAKITPVLHEAVVQGPLKGKVKLYFKLFPIRSHQYGKEGGLALLAAAKLGRFWDYLIYLYDRFDQYCPAKQAEWAQNMGMDASAFERIAQDPATREALVKSKKEGLVNKVDATPTFFINGKKYSGEAKAEELIDFLEEEYERIKGITHRK